MHYWVSCVINKEGFLRFHLCRHTFASLWGACLRFASLWRANSRGDSCVLGVHLSNVCWGLLFCLLKAYIFNSLVPRRSLLPRCPLEVWERVGERTPSQYWQNTPVFSAILPLVTFLWVSTALFSKKCSPIVWMCRLKCLQTAVSSNFVAYYFFWLIFCSSWWIVYGQRFS